MRNLFLLLVIFLTSSIVLADDQQENPFLKQDHFPGGYFLMPDSLPHFMGIYMKEGGMHKINPTDEQEEIIEKQFKHMVSIIMPTAKKIKAIEAKITHQVVFEGKSKQDMSAELKEVVDLRLKLSELQIECLNIFKKTLKPEQYKQMIELAKKSTHE